MAGAARPSVRATAAASSVAGLAAAPSCRQDTNPSGRTSTAPAGSSR